MKILTLTLAALSLVRMPLLAQPTFADVPWISLGGEFRSVNAILPDTNGNVYAGGSFTIPTAFANNIAKWDGNAWSALGSGIGDTNYGVVNALAFDSSGNLYAAGQFTNAGGVSAINIAKWDGSTWSALGSGIGDTNYGVVNALACDANGNLYAGGQFTNAGEVVATNIAKWDGSAWSALGLGVGDTNYYSPVNALAFDSSGNLYAGGEFTNAGEINTTYIAEWNGTAWSALSSGVEGAVSSLTFDIQGNLYAGWEYFVPPIFPSLYSLPTPVGGVSKWNGSSWSPLGFGVTMDGSISGLAFDSFGNLYAAGGFTNVGGVNANYIAEWDGATWSAPSTGLIFQSGVSAFAHDAFGNLYAAGTFTNAGGVIIEGIAKREASVWAAFGSMGAGSLVSVPRDGLQINALVFDASGNLYAGGIIASAGGVSVNNIVKWDGSAWSALGAGITGGTVNTMAIDSQGNLYVGGVKDSYSAGFVDKWNGSTWSALGSGFSGYDLWDNVYALACDKSGNLYAGGSFLFVGGVSANDIAKWDGNAWSVLGLGVSGTVNALAFDNSGNLYAAGGFTTAGGVSATNIAKWDGGNWSALGSGVTGGIVYTMAFDSQGNLYVGGQGGPDSIGFVDTWNGSNWSSIGTAGTLFANYGGPGSIAALACDKFGNVYAGGNFFFIGGVTANAIAKWDGNAWSPPGSAVGGWVSAEVFDSSGNLYVAGLDSAFLAKALLTGPAPNQCLLVNAGGAGNLVAFLGNPGANYAFDMTASLTPPVNWIPQATNTTSTNNATTAGYLTFTNSNNMPQAFYRMRSVQ
jgi:trimeric autotransporter adhesin